MKRWWSAVLLAVAAGASAQTLDRIVAVVDRDVILESELNAQVQFFVLNNHVDPGTPGLKEQVLESMINEKLIVAKAVEDSITVTEDEVRQQLDATIQQRVQQVGSEKRLEELYGMPISRIRREFRDEMRKSLIANRLQQQRFGITQISRREVEEFFAQYRDSLGVVPEEVELAHIYVEPKPSEAARTAAREKMQKLVDSLNAGVDFGELAIRHSQDPGSAGQGGDLGFVRRGLFLPEFESVVFSLAEHQRSGIVETKYGLHVIELLERRGESVRARHILLRVERTPADDDSTAAFLQTLRHRALAGEDFASLARRYSEDKETAPIGGSLGTVELSQIEKAFYATVAALKEGDISEPVKLSAGNSAGYHIVWMKKRTPEHPASLEQDYQRIETLALNFKRNREYQAWLRELREKIYWESRLQPATEESHN
jgi:peptidyl-prolyl cis-trans isomerase SurA